MNDTERGSRIETSGQLSQVVSAPDGIFTVMVHIADLLDLAPPPRQTLSTGFDRLDELTGGFALGSVWVVTSVPGQGRTTLWPSGRHGWLPSTG